MNVFASDLGNRAALATGEIGVDIRLDPRAMGAHSPRIAPNPGRPQFHPVAERETRKRLAPGVELGDVVLRRSSSRGLRPKHAELPLAVR
jgi:hypothetical protein